MSEQEESREVARRLRKSLSEEPEIGLRGMKFTKVEREYFFVEYIHNRGYLVFHFFIPVQYMNITRNPPVTDALGNVLDDGVVYTPTPEALKYWTEVFPTFLDACAQEFFNATFPRIEAAYVPDVTSWFLRCRGFDVIDQKSLCEGFIKAMDQKISSSFASSNQQQTAGQQLS